MFKQETYIKESSSDNFDASSNAGVNVSTEQNSLSTSETNIEASQSYDVNQQVTHKQAFNEAIVHLAVLLYQIDGKVTLNEQDYFDELVASLDWRSGVSLQAHINSAIHESRVAIDTHKTRTFLFELGNALNYNPAFALEVAMAITAIDGDRSDKELELVSLLSNRILARGLVS